MLSLFDGAAGRREFLRVGGLGLGGLALGGLGLPSLFEARRAAAASGVPVKDRSVVFLFLHGGPPQAEMFDPKMTAPGGVRSATGEVETSVPGLAFGATLEKLARRADRLAVVRSFRTGDGRHDIKPVVGRETLRANAGSLYARVAGANHPATSLPTNVALFPRAVDERAQPANTNFGDFRSTGPLGGALAPFVPGGGGELQEDMRLHVDRGRLDDRRHLLSRLDTLRRSLDARGTLESVDRLRQRAYETILGGAADAFDISQEDPRTMARYDTSGLVPEESISKRWNNHRNYVDHVRSLGKLMLLARRLCERGCGFVTVTTNFVWDMHADQNNATVEEGMRYCGVPFDHAVSAFLDDVADRGLSDRILLVACGEMGRTPRINKRGGRDHWGGLAPLLLAGGGVPGGAVVGRSTRDAGEPATEPVTIRHLLSTIYHALLDTGDVRTLRGLPPSVREALTGGEPIPGLL